MNIQTKTVTLKFGIACFNCKTFLKLENPQYYCYFCNFWYCEKCGDKDESMTKAGSMRFIHPHNLVWINVSKEEGMKNIDKYKFGKPHSFIENTQKYGNGQCDSCTQSLDGGYRYICLSCKPGPIKIEGFVDVCQMCMNVLKGKKNSK